MNSLKYIGEKKKLPFRKSNDILIGCARVPRGQSEELRILSTSRHWIHLDLCLSFAIFVAIFAIFGASFLLNPCCYTIIFPCSGRLRSAASASRSFASAVHAATKERETFAWKSDWNVLKSCEIHIRTTSEVRQIPNFTNTDMSRQRDEPCMAAMYGSHVWQPCMAAMCGSHDASCWSMLVRAGVPWTRSRHEQGTYVSCIMLHHFRSEIWSISHISPWVERLSDWSLSIVLSAWFLNTSPARPCRDQCLIK